MKTTSIIFATLIVCISSTTFAAVNPFSDVPAGHWAYRSVSKLAAAGVIEGYGDGTFHGNKNITRYEMAQMIAKAVAKNPQGANKAELDRLIAEFRDELDALGFRVSNLEKFSDKITVSGKIEYDFDYWRYDPYNTGKKTTRIGKTYTFRLDAKATLDEHWSANTRIESYGDLQEDMTFDFNLVQAWAQGNYGDLEFKVGKFELSPDSEFGLVWDTEISGAELIFGSKWKLTATGGRLDSVKVLYGWNGISFVDLYDYDPSTLIGLHVDYNQGGKGLFGGAGYYHIEDDDFAWRGRKIFCNANTIGNYNRADIWTVNLGYQLGNKFSIHSAYAKNTKADWENNSWQVELTYGDYDDNPKKGQWSVFAAYRKFGTNTTLQGSVYDDVMLGTRGFVIGASLAPLENIGISAKYFSGKFISDFNGGRGKADKFAGEVDIFF